MEIKIEKRKLTEREQATTLLNETFGEGLWCWGAASPTIYHLFDGAVMPNSHYKPAEFISSWTGIQVEKTTTKSFFGADKTNRNKHRIDLRIFSYSFKDGDLMLEEEPIEGLK